MKTNTKQFAALLKKYNKGKCPKCGAKDGERCKTPSGKLYPIGSSFSHEERWIGFQR